MSLHGTLTSVPSMWSAAPLQGLRRYSSVSSNSSFLLLNAVSVYKYFYSSALPTSRRLSSFTGAAF